MAMTSRLREAGEERRGGCQDVLRRTGSLLGEQDGCKDWVSESRSSNTPHPSVWLPRQRSAPLSKQLDRGRRNNPQPRLASIFRARHGQRDVCAVETLLPEVREPEVTERSAYQLEFPDRPVPHYVRWTSAPVIPSGILPSCRIQPYDDVREEILLPVDITEQSPSTDNPNKYVARRRRVSDCRNQHMTHDTPYDKHVLQSAPPYGRCQRDFITTEGRALPHRRHLSAPPSCLKVKGFDGGAARLSDNTMHAQLLPYLRGPRII